MHPSMQALRRKVTVAELGQLRPLSLKSPFFFSASQWLFEHFRQDKHTNRQIHRQHQRHRVSYPFSEAFDYAIFMFAVFIIYLNVYMFIFVVYCLP